MVVIKESNSGEVLLVLEAETLRRGSFSNKDLAKADLQSVDLHGADLRWANLSSAQLKGADLSRANLTGANLMGANLRDANLKGANLQGAFLGGGIIHAADQTVSSRTDLRGAIYDRATQWPPRFDPRSRGAVAV